MKKYIKPSSVDYSGVRGAIPALLGFGAAVAAAVGLPAAAVASKKFASRMVSEAFGNHLEKLKYNSLSNNFTSYMKVELA